MGVFFLHDLWKPVAELYGKGAFKPARFTTLTVRFTGATPDPAELPSERTLTDVLREKFLRSDKARAARLDTILGCEIKPSGNYVVNWPSYVSEEAAKQFGRDIIAAITDRHGAVIETNVQWTKFVVSGVRVHDEDGERYSSERLLRQLQLNEGFGTLKFVWPPRWLIKDGYPDPNIGCFTVGVEDKDLKLQKALEKSQIPLFMFSNKSYARKYHEREIWSPCTKCWKTSHKKSECPDERATCRKCGGPHWEASHRYECLCARAGRATCTCPPKCGRCKGHHFADSVDCPFRRGYRNPINRGQQSSFIAPMDVDGAERVEVENIMEEERMAKEREEMEEKIKRMRDEDKRIERLKQEAEKEAEKMRNAHTLNGGNTLVPSSQPQQDDEINMGGNRPQVEAHVVCDRDGTDGRCKYQGCRKTYVEESRDWN
jgi:hypothetical protein